MSIFDLYSLEVGGHMRVPAGLMDLFLKHVNLEISIEAADPREAYDLLDILRAALYAAGMSPTIVPLATSHSLNAYAGINARSSPIRHSSLPDDLSEGITIHESKVKSWSKELTFSCLRGDSNETRNCLTSVVFSKAVEDAAVWRRIEEKHAPARIVRGAMNKAPLMPDISSSILHIWQALESLFRVQSEITHRISLLLAQLLSSTESRATTYSVARKSYRDRSRIAHGSESKLEPENWTRAWLLLCNAHKSILSRGGLPSEDDLIRELLA